MENSANSQVIYNQNTFTPFVSSLHQKNQLYHQTYLGNQHVVYNPYSFYNTYWGLPNEYQMPQQYFNPHQNYWSPVYMKQQRILSAQDSAGFKQKKLEAPGVKIEHKEQPQACPTKEVVKQPRRKYKLHKKHRKNNVTYYWSLEENKRYSEFLQQHGGLFSLSLSQKKNLRVNVMMSKKVKTRTPQQCHSHHQKMMKKYGLIEHIVEVMKMERDQAQKKRLQQVREIQKQDQVLKDHIKQQRESSL